MTTELDTKTETEVTPTPFSHAEIKLIIDKRMPRLRELVNNPYFDISSWHHIFLIELRQLRTLEYQFNTQGDLDKNCRDALSCQINDNYHGDVTCECGRINITSTKSPKQGHILEINPCNYASTITCGIYVNDKKEGKFVTYKISDFTRHTENMEILGEEHRITQEIEYKNGLMNGNFIKYETVYKNDPRRIIEKGMYIDDLKTDICVSYYYNSKIKEKGLYINGMKCGKWTYFNEDHTVKEEIDHGNVIKKDL
jgi:hypothetical protein